MKRGLAVVVGVFILSLLVFGTAFYIQQNYEFMKYQITIACYAIAVYLTHKKFNYPQTILWGMALLAMLHMLGGVNFGSGLVYGQMLLPIGDSSIIRYDHIVHFFGTFMVALLLHHLLRPSLRRDGIVPHLVLILGAVGIGAMIEITEFFVALYTPENFVGGYQNISLDLIFNSLGAIVAITIRALKERT